MAEKRELKKPGVLGQTTGFIINITFWLFVSLISSIIIEWLGIYFSWWSSGDEHSKIMLNEELVYANETIRDVFLGDDQGSYLFWVFNKFLFVMDVTLQFLANTIQSITTIILRFTTIGAYIPTDRFEIYTSSAFNISLVFLLRLFLILFALPLFLMSLLWGFVDGLVERDLRRFGAGRESSTIFDGAKSMIAPFFVAPLLVYLSFPEPINPVLIIAPSVLVQCVLYRTLFSKYKKYV